MDYDNVLAVMCSYDFSTPLKTVIIIEDNENTDNEQNTGNQNVEKSNEDNQASPKENTDSVQQVPLEKNYIQNSDSQSYNTQGNKVTESRNSNLNQDDTVTVSNNKTTPEVDYAYESDNLYRNNGPSPGRKRYHLKPYDRGGKKKCTTEADTNEESKKSEFYIKSTLKIVSENLLHIVAAKAQLQKNLNDKNSKLYGQENLVNSQLLAIRFSYFKMTYSVTVTILLPLQNNKMFIKTLLESTLEFGSANGIYSSYDELAKLYSDMLLWTKEFRYRYVPPITLVHEEYRPFIKLRSPPLNTESANKQHTCQQMQQPLNTENTNKQYNCQQMPQPFQNNNAQKLLSTPRAISKGPPPSYDYCTRNQKNYYSVTTNSNNNSRVTNNNVNCTSAPNTQSLLGSYNLPQANNNQTTEIVTSHYFQKSNEDNQSMMQVNSLPNTIFSKTAPTNSITAKRSAPMLTTPYAHIDLNESVISYGMREPNNTTTIIAPYGNDQTSQILNPYGQQNETRSISRDSGFMSPLLNNKESTTEMQLNPVIAEVTSLNPNAQHVPVGTCIVCQKTTRKVCLGCYREHYCSFECMLSNWPIHKLQCRH